MNVSSDDQLSKLLGTIHLGALTAHGQYVKALCPFHENASGKTLWIDRDSGSWGCWSTRCPRHKGGSLLYLFYLKGYSWEQAHQIVNSFEWNTTFATIKEGFVSQQDLDAAGVITKAHLGLWRVDWHLAEAVLRILQGHPRTGECFGLPLHTWADVPVSPGQVEHDHWYQLFYMLRTRGVSPDSLHRMRVGFDRRLGMITFPIFTPEGKLLGVGRREPMAGAKYYLSGTYRGIKDQDYVAVPVPRGQCLWGWVEQADRIEAREPIVVVEGYIDQLRLLDYGFCTVSKLGKQLTQEQIALLMGVPNPVIHWPDYDTDGLLYGVKDVIALLGKPQNHVVLHPQGLKDAGECPRLLAQWALRNRLSVTQFMERLPELLLSVKYKK